MLRNEINELKARINILDGKIPQLNGGTTFLDSSTLLNLKMIEETILGFYPAINKYIRYQKKAGNDIYLLAGIKIALDGMELRSGLLSEAENSGYKLCRISSRLFACSEARDKMQCLELIKEGIDELEARNLNLAERGIGYIKSLIR